MQEETNKPDDTDVYVLLLYYYLDRGLNIPMVMHSPYKGRAHVDITVTMLQAQLLIRCDTVPMS